MRRRKTKEIFLRVFSVFQEEFFLQVRAPHEARRGVRRGEASVRRGEASARRTLIEWISVSATFTAAATELSKWGVFFLVVFF